MTDTKKGHDLRDEDALKGKGHDFTGQESLEGKRYDHTGQGQEKESKKSSNKAKAPKVTKEDELKELRDTFEVVTGKKAPDNLGAKKLQEAIDIAQNPPKEEKEEEKEEKPEEKPEKKKKKKKKLKVIK